MRRGRAFSANGDTVCKGAELRLTRPKKVCASAFCSLPLPSTTPSLRAIMTGQTIHRLESGANLWSTLPAKFQTYPDILEHAGYTVGFTRKGWGPGENGERPRNPAGPSFKTFDAFLKTVPADKPFSAGSAAAIPTARTREGEHQRRTEARGRKSPGVSARLSGSALRTFSITTRECSTSTGM